MPGEQKGKYGAWYCGGLQFECQQCGSCCRISGLVWVSPKEIRIISKHMEISEEEFRRLCLIKVGSGFSIGEAKDGSCLMLDSATKRCKIYEVRPEQCSSFPFWPEVLKNPVTWAKEGLLCPGMSRGKLWTYEEIEERKEKD